MPTIELRSQYAPNYTERGSVYGITSAPVLLIKQNQSLYTISVPAGALACNWSGKFMPKIGDRVNVCINRMGEGVVVAYFVEHGYLGVEVILDKRPDWHVKHNGNRHPHPLAFGAEIDQVQSKSEFIQKHKGQMREHAEQAKARASEKLLTVYGKHIVADLSDTGPYATGDDAELAKQLEVSVLELRRDRARSDRPEIKCGTNIPEFWEMVKVVIDKIAVRGLHEIILWRDRKFNNVFAWHSSVIAYPEIKAPDKWEKCATFKLHTWHKEEKGWEDAWRGAVTDAMGWSWRAQTIWREASGKFRWTSTRDGSPRKVHGGRWVRVMKVTPHIFTK